MNKCVNIVFILLYSETLFEGRNVYVQICKIKNKLCFIYRWFVVHYVEFVRLHVNWMSLLFHIGFLILLNL